MIEITTLQKDGMHMHSNVDSTPKKIGYAYNQHAQVYCYFFSKLARLPFLTYSGDQKSERKPYFVL